MSNPEVRLKLEPLPENLWQLARETRASHQVEMQRLTVAVALEVEGWLEIPVEPSEERRFLKPRHLESGDPHDTDAPLSELPAYSTDRNACADAEARIMELGLGEAYTNHMIADGKEARQLPGGGAMSYSFYCLTASPETRCQAMLKTIRAASVTK